MDGRYYKSQVWQHNLFQDFTLYTLACRLQRPEPVSTRSYEFMRKNLVFYRSEIHRLTGKVKDEALMLSDSKEFLYTVQFMSSF